ncbi:Lipopolysaccharide-assembly, LptC-related [Rhodobacteraceae bacterium THAF1]|uniref:LPS export ABC transporter periplasmic protein LptC n=1 Tax=Palleronia sp. THAF1 TaxID=2587842 RepID=UPI000F40D2B3|nr:LPS export ABC transporter periplasmic protein LptC [Palleronia sp. THAF1]QFU07113.1 Lipopolysaccharide-assembly, LptC-related [Palleronia sp. THAF1]VDC16734.1 Lipopolysaccharide-assembly, LptC-related [Rhodobacteraceae bacterium THAF1]
MSRSSIPKRTGHFDNRHSRWVARLKVALPLAALAILSTLFLVADRRGSGDSIPFTDVEIDRILTEGRIANPDYAGLGSDGAAVTLRAAEAQPGTSDQDTSRATTVSGSWTSRSGAEVTLTSERGTLSRANDDIRVEGDVRVVDAQGYTVESDALEVDGTTNDIASPGPVTGVGPVGRIEAGAMALSQNDDTPTMRFTNGVRVVYDPATPESE